MVTIIDHNKLGFKGSSIRTESSDDLEVSVVLGLENLPVCIRITMGVVDSVNSVGEPSVEGVVV